MTCASIETLVEQARRRWGIEGEIHRLQHLCRYYQREIDLLPQGLGGYNDPRRLGLMTALADAQTRIACLQQELTRPVATMRTNTPHLFVSAPPRHDLPTAGGVEGS